MNLPRVVVAVVARHQNQTLELGPQTLHDRNTRTSHVDLPQCAATPGSDTATDDGTAATEPRTETTLRHHQAVTNSAQRPLESAPEHASQNNAARVSLIACVLN